VVCRSVCRSATLVSPAKKAAPIEMPFGLWAWMGRRNHVLDRGPAVLRDVAMASWQPILGRNLVHLALWAITLVV